MTAGGRHMESGASIANELRQAIAGEPWHGPSLEQLLEGLTAVDAAAHPVPGAHSVWELVAHLTTWATVAQRRLAGHPVEPTSAEDWPPQPAITDAEAWTVAQDQLAAAFFDLASAAEDLTDAELDAMVPGRSHDARVLLHGTSQHAAYHGGQIAILRRALAGG